MRFELQTALSVTLLALAAGPVAAQGMSREFKMPLLVDRFASQPDAGGSVYARQLTELIRQAHGVEVLPTASREKVRTVQFLDSFGTCKIRSSGFILRQREDDKGRRQLTLKTRSTDSDWVRKTEVAAAPAFKSKGKLEEDVLPPDRSQLSRSVTVTLPEGEPLPSTMDAAARIFPVLGTMGAASDFLGPVENLKAMERGYVLPKWKVGSTTFEVEIALWLSEAGKVLFAETSFRYTVPEDPAEAQAASAQAGRLFSAMQADKAWAGKLSVSKTDYIYNSGGGKFCRRTFESFKGKAAR